MKTVDITIDVLDLTLVIDIGKSHAKLLIVDASGSVIERHERDNVSVPSSLGYLALDIYGLEAWIAQTLRGSIYTVRCGHAITSTHGAAIVALDDDGLAWEPLDYEFDCLAQHPLIAQTFDNMVDHFAHTLSPELPSGLNAARQLFYMEYMQPRAWLRTRYLLPYPQYWAWRLSGQRASEVSSLGCHTHLWHPQGRSFSDFAKNKGWATLFAPLRSAWEVLGTVSPAIAVAWGLPERCQVYVGAHDSNACLARYLPSADELGASSQALTVVSSGTWTVLMAPGAPTASLQADRDMLANVDVLGRATPTARFMGGRDFAFLLDGATPDAGSIEIIQRLVDLEIFAMPSFASDKVSKIDDASSLDVWVIQQGQRLHKSLSLTLNAAERSTLAAMYCALHTAWLVRKLWEGSNSVTYSVIVEGPLAQNTLYLGILQALLPEYSCLSSTDALEGTARGAWLLSRWDAKTNVQFLQSTPRTKISNLNSYRTKWLALLS